MRPPRESRRPPPRSLRRRSPSPRSPSPRSPSPRSPSPRSPSPRSPPTKSLLPKSPRRTKAPSARVPFVGLTGGLGSGKSEALRALGELGAATLSTDAVVAELLSTPALREEIVSRLGPEVAPDGSLDRSAIAERVFGDEEERKWLEGVLWPKVGERVMSWRTEVEALEPPPPAAVVEVPLLFEAGMEEAFDSTIAVVADEDARASRAGARGHAAVDERAAAQLSQEEKAQRADFAVRNDGTLEELRVTLSRLLDTIGT